MSAMLPPQCVLLLLVPDVEQLYCFSVRVIVWFVLPTVNLSYKILQELKDDLDVWKPVYKGKCIIIFIHVHRLQL